MAVATVMPEENVRVYDVRCVTVMETANASTNCTAYKQRPCGEPSARSTAAGAAPPPLPPLSCFVSVVREAGPATNATAGVVERADLREGDLLRPTITGRRTRLSCKKWPR